MIKIHNQWLSVSCHVIHSFSSAVLPILCPVTPVRQAPTEVTKIEIIARVHEHRKLFSIFQSYYKHLIMSGNVELFTTRMRKATRKIHSVSDALVNAKFAISLRDETVWGGGLFVFYHIFAFLEDAKERLNMPDFNRLFVHKTLYRKKAFEADLSHYLGEDWQSTPRSVALDSYLEHLQELEKDSPQLLMAYVYHLYLGLLSGGQILAKKRKVFGDKTNTEVYTDQVTDFTDIDIPQLKNDFRAAMNEIAAKMSPEEQQAFIEESSQVFLMNNLIVNSVAGQNQVLRSLFYKTSAVFLVVFGAVLAYKMSK